MALQALKKIVMIKPKVPTIKFARISLMAFCRYSFVVAFVTVLNVVLAMTIKRTA